MIEIKLPGFNGKFFLDATTGIVYKADKRTMVIYRDGDSGSWNAIVSYLIADRTIVDILNDAMETA